MSDGDVQHGDRMETWALRICLLWELVSLALGTILAALLATW